MTGVGFLDLPVSDQQEIVDRVKACAATFHTDETIKSLTSRQIEDIARWVLDGARNTTSAKSAYDDGYEQGHEDGFAEATGAESAAS